MSVQQTYTPVLQGALPVVHTIFHDDESLDLEGYRRTIDFLIDSGAAAICILAKYSEQFSLDDDERAAVLRTSMEHVAGRIPVVITTSAYSARVAHHRTRAALEHGAAIAMMMAPFFGATMTVSPLGVMDYFGRVIDGLNIDVMIQDAPMSPTALSVETLAKMAREIPQVRHVKLEMPRAASKIRDLISRAGSDLPGIYDGEEGITLIPDLDAGASATMCSSTAPEVLAEVVQHFRDGQRDHGVDMWENVLPLIHFENRQCGPSASKIVLAEGGVIRSARMRAPSPEVGGAQRTELIKLARRKDVLALRWAQ